MSDTAPAAVDNSSGGDSSAPQAEAPQAPQAPQAPKPLKIKNFEFQSEDAAWSEIERGRQSNKLLAQAQKLHAEANLTKKQIDDLKTNVKTKKDAKLVIDTLGLSKEEAVEMFGRWLYQEEVVAKEMSPEQRRIRELEAEVAKTREEREAKTKAEQEAQHAQEVKKQEAKLREELTKVLEAKKVPATRLALRRLANYLHSYSASGADIPVERAADLVMEDYKQEYGELIDTSTPEQLIEFLGKAKWMNLAKKVSEWAMKRNGPSPQDLPQPPVRVGPSQKTENSDKMSPQEFQRFLRSVK